MWIGVLPDLADPDSDDPVGRESTRESAVMAYHPQCSYDLRVWAQLVYPPPPDDRKVQEAYRLAGLGPPTRSTRPGDGGSPQR